MSGELVFLVSSSDEEEPPPKKKAPNISGLSVPAELSIMVVESAKTVLEDQKPEAADLKSAGQPTRLEPIQIVGTECAKVGLSDLDLIVIDDLEDELTSSTQNSSESSKESESPSPSDHSKGVNGSTLQKADTSDVPTLENTIKIENVISLNPVASSSTASDIKEEVEQFLKYIENCVKDSRYEDKLLANFPKFWKNFDKCCPMSDETGLRDMLMRQQEVAKLSPENAVFSFNTVNNLLKDVSRCGVVELPKEKARLVYKLEKTMAKLVRRIKRLEEAEVDFDEENDSTYIMHDVYTKRLHAVHRKYCEILKKNPYADRPEYQKIQFVSSNYVEINREITRKYHSRQFPTYYELEKCIRKCVDTHNLPLTEQEIKSESKFCFVQLGKILKTLRRKDLYDCHSMYLENLDDPANQNSQMDEELKSHSKEAEQKYVQIFKKFSSLQEHNNCEDISSDSDDSNYKDSDVSEDAT